MQCLAEALWGHSKRIFLNVLESCITVNICFKAVKHLVFCQLLLFCIHLFLRNAEQLQTLCNTVDVDESSQTRF